jgi:hypothetical protein
MDENEGTYSNKRKRNNSFQKSKAEISNELLLLELLDYVQKNTRVDDIVLNAYCKGEKCRCDVIKLKKNSSF